METVTVDDAVIRITHHYKALSALVPLHAITNVAEYERAVAVMNALLDAGAADEHHPLADLLATLGRLIGDYEIESLENAPASPAYTLRFLMEQHQINQSELKEIGSQGVVSEILNGKRELNLRQIKALAKRFNVPSSVFLK